MKLKFKKLLLNLGLLSGVTTIAISAQCNTPKQINGGKEVIPPDKPAKPNKPINNGETTGETNELDKFIKDFETNLQINKENSGEFYESVSRGDDFYYDRIKKVIISVPKGTFPNWTQEKYSPLLDFGEFTNDIGVKNIQLANPDNPTYKSSDGSNKISSKIKLSVNQSNDIVVSFKLAKYFKDGNHIFSSEICTKTLGKILSNELVEKMKKLTEAEENTTFTYPDAENVLLSDADENKIVKSIPDGYELAEFKAVKNDEDQYYDYTIIFKLKILGTDIVSPKNVFKTIKNFKKSSRILELEAKAKAEMENSIAKLEIKFSNIKAYNIVVKTFDQNTQLTESSGIFDYNNKPNFVVNNSDDKVYKYELKNLRRSNDEMFVTVKASSIVNNSIYVEKEVKIKPEFQRGINPYNMTTKQQHEYLTNELNKIEFINPFFSKDRTYINKSMNQKLNNKSFWLDAKNNDLLYEFGNLSVEKNEQTNDKTFYVGLSLSFQDYVPTEAKPRQKLTKKIKINLDELGVDKLNKINLAKNKQTIQDIEAPTATVDINYEPEIKSEYYVDNESQNLEPKSLAVGKNILPIYKHFNKPGNDIIYVDDQETYDNLLSDSANKVLWETYKFDENNNLTSNNVFFKNSPYLVNNKYSQFTAFAFTDFRNENGILTGKMVICEKGFAANNTMKAAYDENRVGIVRVKIMSPNKYKSNVKTEAKKAKLYLYFTNLYENKTVEFTFKDIQNYTSEQIKDNKELLKQNIIVQGLPDEWEIIDYDDLRTNSKKPGHLFFKCLIGIKGSEISTFTTLVKLEGFKTS
ncbi:hypothetical protein [Mycoplasma zalophidermidis]|uniref:hypothetical protein n=1 Tax=Mycoplasma zalophidermidis TaxID=398174 RepID=UPI00215BC0CE|nr:hypothetical protein [Mycoplasma zalophidermidis]MCR8966665.1 hypothetical protein [Mycoplasma zalophidermidis]